MITFETETGSSYEVDDNTKRMRRAVAGSHDTVRATPEWREFAYRSPLYVGRRAVFVWTDATPLLEGSPAGTVPMTETSIVTSVSR